MKKLLIIGVLAAVGVVYLGCAKEKSGHKFPTQIGEYSKKEINNMPLCPSMESNIMITYTGHRGWAIVLYGAYKTEEAAKIEYNKAEESGRKRYEVRDIEGMYKTSFLHNTVNVSFGWREGKIFKIVTISKQKQANENIDDIEEQLKEKLPLFIDAFKGL